MLPPEEDDDSPPARVLVTIFRFAWHSGFGGTATGETTEPVRFLKQLRHDHGSALDWVEVSGCYQVWRE